jgi:hypothetical protein
MNGASVYGWVKVAMVAVAIFALAYFGRRIAAWLRNPFESNVFSTAADSVTESLTGDPSLGGWLAEKLSPTVRAANAAMRPPAVKTVSLAIKDNYVGDLPIDSSPGIVSNEGGAAVGIIRKMR